MQSDARRSARSDQPIFIVGTPRSGTTLLASLMSSHSKVSCGPETHFFAQTTRVERQNAVSDDAWPEKAVKLITSLQIEKKPVHEVYNLSVDDIRKFLESEIPSERALLEALVFRFAQQNGKKIWLEKTPRHLKHVGTIRSIYPSAHIIHIIRDPRDTVRSLTKVPWAPSSWLSNAVRWKEEEQHAETFKESDSHFISIRYEDLLASPNDTLRSICAWVGISFEGNMIDPASSADHVITENEPWKANVRNPIDPSNAFKWKDEMSAGEARAISLVCHEGIQQHGYSDPVFPQRTIPAYGLNYRESNEAIERIVRMLAEERIFLEPCELMTLLTRPRNEVKEIALLKLPPLGQGRLRRLLRLLGISAVISSRVMVGAKVYYRGERGSSDDRLTRVMHHILHLVCIDIRQLV